MTGEEWDDRYYAELERVNRLEHKDGNLAATVAWTRTVDRYGEPPPCEVSKLAARPYPRERPFASGGLISAGRWYLLGESGCSFEWPTDPAEPATLTLHLDNSLARFEPGRRFVRIAVESEPALPRRGWLRALLDRMFA